MHRKKLISERSVTYKDRFPCFMGFYDYHTRSDDAFRGSDHEAQQYEWEFSVLLGMYRSLRPMYVLEIGTRKGGTLYEWIKSAPDGCTVISIDSDVNSIDAETVKTWEERDVSTHVIKTRSQDAFKEVQNLVPQLDFLFIDGGHGLHEVSSDFHLYGRMCRKNSLIALHDIVRDLRFPGIQVFALWEQIRSHGFVTQELISNSGEKGIGVIHVDRDMSALEERSQSQR